MSIKRIDPDFIEITSVVMHPKRRYSSRPVIVVAAASDIPSNAITTEDGTEITTEGSDFVTTET